MEKAERDDENDDDDANMRLMKTVLFREVSHELFQPFLYSYDLFTLEFMGWLSLFHLVTCTSRFVGRGRSRHYTCNS